MRFEPKIRKPYLSSGYISEEDKNKISAVKKAYDKAESSIKTADDHIDRLNLEIYNQDIVIKQLKKQVEGYRNLQATNNRLLNIIEKFTLKGDK